MSLDVLEGKVLEWAEQKGILEANEPDAQLDKFEEECWEFIEACCSEDFDEIQKEGGDVIVTLIINLHLRGSSLSQALQAAYDKISKRKGTMVDGVFVKEGD